MWGALRGNLYGTTSRISTLADKCTVQTFVRTKTTKVKVKAYRPYHRISAAKKRYHTNGQGRLIAHPRGNMQGKKKIFPNYLNKVKSILKSVLYNWKRNLLKRKTPLELSIPREPIGRSRGRLASQLAELKASMNAQQPNTLVGATRQGLIR